MQRWSWLAITLAVFIFNLVAFKMFWWMFVLWLGATIYFFYHQKQRGKFRQFTKLFVIVALLMFMRVGWVVYHASPAHNSYNWLAQMPITVTIVETGSNWQIVQNQQDGQRNLLFLTVAHPLVSGQTLTFCGNWKKITATEKQQQFFWWAKSYQVQGTFFQHNKCQLKIQNPTSWRWQFKQWLTAHTDKRFRNWVNWLLFQDNTAFSKQAVNFTKVVQKLGVVHLFIISGFHLMIGTQIFMYGIKKIRSKKWQNIGYLCLFAFTGWIVYLTNFKIPALKAWMLIIIQVVCLKWQRFHWAKERLALVFLILVFYWPLLIWQTGFQITFLASWVLSYQKQHSKWTSHLQNFVKKQLLVILILVPILIELQNGISLLILVYLTLFTIGSWVFYPVFFITIWIRPVWVVWSEIFRYTGLMMQKFEQINVVWHLWNWEPVWKLLYYSLGGVVLICWSTKKRKWYLIGMLVLALGGINYVEEHQRAHYHFHMLDTGHGLAMLIRTHNNRETVLLDAGIGKRPHNHSRRILKYLSKWNIQKLNAVFISHQHTDHYNNLAFLQKNILIETIWNYQNERAEYQIGELKFYNLNFQKAKSHWNPNNQSLVLLTQLHQHWFLLPFDIEEEVELQIAQNWQYPPVTVLQVAHHGSNTSSTNAFLKRIRPKYCLVSNQRTIATNVSKRLANFCQIFTTREFGNIAVSVTNSQVRITKYNI